MTKAEALRIARNRVTMRRQGNGWIVRVYDPKVNAYREGNERPYDRAKADLTESRLYEALTQLGWNDFDARWGSCHEQRGSLSDRLNSVLAMSGGEQ